jgi:thiamine-phosphate diphosphorylase
VVAGEGGGVRGPVRLRVGLPVLHVVTDDTVLLRADFGQVAEAVLRAGGADLALHLRGPSLDGRLLLYRGRELLLTARTSGAWVVVNDRVDVAGCITADGVQLGQRSLPLDVVRRLLGTMRVGISVHDPGEARKSAGADWLLAGTLFETPSHPGRAPSGVEILRTIGEVVPGVPLVGIGGITPERVAGVRAAGARGIAVLRGVWDDPSPGRAVERYLTAWRDAGTGEDAET